MMMAGDILMSVYAFILIVPQSRFGPSHYDTYYCRHFHHFPNTYWPGINTRQEMILQLSTTEQGVGTRMD
jgi:hypothetical protein